MTMTTKDNTADAISGVDPRAGIAPSATSDTASTGRDTEPATNTASAKDTTRHATQISATPANPGKQQPAHRRTTTHPAAQTTQQQASGVAAVTAAVAQHVRSLRQARGWSLDELSARSGVSKGMVVQIEGARTNPSVGTLLRVADAFGVSITRLLEPTAERSVRVNSVTAAPLLWRGGYGGFARLLAGVPRPEPVELWEWWLQPRDEYPGGDQAPGARALVHVLTGEVTLTVAGTDYRVRAGETISFVADRAYRCRNEGNEQARLIGALVLPGVPTWD